MINNKKIMKIIDIIYWLIIIITTIIQATNTIHIDGTELDELRSSNFLQLMQFGLVILFVIIFQLVIALIKNFIITVIYFGIKIAYKKYIKEKQDKKDYKNESYYREIIPELSPAVLSYIYNFQLNEKDIVGTLLGLQLKKKIDIKNKIEIKDISEENLTENEKYIFQNLKNGTLKNINMTLWEQKVILDCKQKGLLEEKQNIKREIIKKITISIIMYIVIFILFNKSPYIFNKYVANNDSFIILFFIIMLILFFTMIIYPYKTAVYIKTYYFMNKLNPYIRNKKAKEINEKLEGLKNYIKDYSMINERKKEEIDIWEDYLIYSVIFDENIKIVKDVINMIK